MDELTLVSDKDSLEYTGTVLYYNTTGGYGFIQPTCDGVSEDVFFYTKLIPIKEGEQVRFNYKQGRRGLCVTELWFDGVEAEV